MTHMFGSFSNLQNKLVLNKIINRVHNHLPAHIECSQFDSWFKCDVFDCNKIIGSMSQAVHSGISTSKDLSILKALMEYFERKAVYASDFKYTNGAAAQPILLSRKQAIEIARVRSFNESLERFGFFQ